MSLSDDARTADSVSSHHTPPDDYPTPAVQSASITPAAYGAQRKVLKDTFTEEMTSVEEFLYGIDPYRYTTATPPLPLPLENIYDDLEWNELKVEIEQSKELAGFLRSSLAGHNFHLEVAMRSQVRGEGRSVENPTRTLIIYTRIEDVSHHDWVERLSSVKSGLSMHPIMVALGLPYYDVEIFDIIRSWQPVQYHSGEYDPPYVAYLAALEDLKQVFDQNLPQEWTEVKFADLVQPTGEGPLTQMTIIVTVQPGTSHSWRRLRSDILRIYLGAFDAIYPDLSVDVDVEFVPTYNVLIRSQTSSLVGTQTSFSEEHYDDQSLEGQSTTSQNIPKGDSGSGVYSTGANQGSISSAKSEQHAAGGYVPPSAELPLGFSRPLYLPHPDDSAPSSRDTADEHVAGGYVTPPAELPPGSSGPLQLPNPQPENSPPSSRDIIDKPVNAPRSIGAAGVDDWLRGVDANASQLDRNPDTIQKQPSSDDGPVNASKLPPRVHQPGPRKLIVFGNEKEIPKTAVQKMWKGTRKAFSKGNLRKIFGGSENRRTTEGNRRSLRSSGNENDGRRSWRHFWRSRSGNAE